MVPICSEPDCHAPVEVYSRIVGYLRPVSCWNPGKREEFGHRVDYTFWNGDHIE